MADAEVKLKITGDAAGAVAAAQQTGTAMDKMAGPRMKLVELTQQEKDRIKESSAATQENTSAVSDSGRAQEETTRAAKLHGGAQRDLHRLMHEVTEESPVLGLAMKAAFSPQGAAIMAVIMALRLLEKEEEEAKAKALESAGAAARGYGDMVEPINQAVDAAEEAKTAFDKWTRAQSQNLGSINQELQLEITKLHLIKTGTEEVVEAEKAAALKKLEIDKASGTISPAQYEQRRAAVEEASRQVKSGLDAAALAQEITKRKEALAKVRAEENRYGDEAAAAGAAVTSPEAMARRANAGHLAQQAAEAKRLAEEAKAQIPKAQEEAAQAKEEVRFPSLGQTAENALGLGITFPGTQRAMQQAQNKDAEAQRLEKERKDQAALAQKSEDEAARLRVAEKQEKDRLDEAQKAYNAFREQARTQEAELKKLQAEQAITGDANATAEPFKQFSAIAETPIGKTAIADIGAAENTAKGLEQHKQVSDEAKQQLIDIASAIAGHQVSLQQAVAMMKNATANMGTFTDEVLKLAGVLQTMVSLHSSLAKQVTAIRTNVENLLKQQSADLARQFGNLR